ncbi:hypothetical protein ABT300_01030 [Streptomyces sp. NPDC001027]|uniref:hypothetical protein n=1 Tax=Streptomyces sp. NPDC001027 TaxID=3154771 RepID=UPI00332AFA9F
MHRPWSREPTRISALAGEAPGSVHRGPYELAADGGGGAPGKDFASAPARKRAAAKAIEEHLEPDTSKAGAKAAESTGAAVTAFGQGDGEDWLTGQALKTAKETWSQQLTTLMNRLGSEKAALRATGLLLQSTDTGVGSGIRNSSVLDAF